MKKIILLLFLPITITLSAQSNTEIYLLDIIKSSEKIELVNLKNISNNEGYDNQPAFYNDNTILFSSIRNNQTDISSYNIEQGKSSWISKTNFGSEYSPLKIPNKEEVSAIRLDTSGLQRLYQYNLVNGKSKVLLKDLKVGYHVWYDSKILISSVLVDDRMDLVVSNLENNTNHTVQKNVGRSLHKIPNSNLISFIAIENGKSSIKTLNPISGEIKTIIDLPQLIKDMCWLSGNVIIIPDGKMLAQFNTTDSTFSILHHFLEDEINEISRVSISPDGKHLALVSEQSPAITVQKQVDAYNEGDLNKFISHFSENVVIRNFSNDTLFKGNSELKSNYQQFFSRNPKANVKVIKRIIKKNIVIDEERIQINGNEHHQATIYELKNGEIFSVTIIPPKEKISNAEVLVQQQHDAFNSRDVANFVKNFSDDIKSYNFPNKLFSEGQKQLYDEFLDFFTKTPDLHSVILNRIAIGNIIIDEESLTVNGDNFRSIAIYEIAKEKIFKMTEIR